MFSLNVRLMFHIMGFSVGASKIPTPPLLSVAIHYPPALQTFPLVPPWIPAMAAITFILHFRFHNEWAGVAKMDCASLCGGPTYMPRQERPALCCCCITLLYFNNLPNPATVMHAGARF